MIDWFFFSPEVKMKVFSFGCLTESESRGLPFNHCYDRDNVYADNIRFKMELEKYFNSVTLTNFRGKICVSSDARFQLISSSEKIALYNTELIIFLSFLLTRIVFIIYWCFVWYTCNLFVNFLLLTVVFLTKHNAFFLVFLFTLKVYSRFIALLYLFRIWSYHRKVYERNWSY